MISNQGIIKGDYPFNTCIPKTLLPIVVNIHSMLKWEYNPIIRWHRGDNIWKVVIKWLFQNCLQSLKDGGQCC